MRKRKSTPERDRSLTVTGFARLCHMASHENDTNDSSAHDELKRKRLSEIREKIDRGLKQLDEGFGISAKDARARLRRIRSK